jgi:hypothetical protein
MPSLDPYLLSEQECKEIATRMLLFFITLSDTQAERSPQERLATGEPLLSFDALPDGAIGDGPALFNWMSHDIYDVDGLLLFRDQALDLGFGYELCVRVAACDLLKTQVYCVKTERHMNLKALKERALAHLRSDPDLEPFIAEGEEDVRIVAYSYPKLGILCRPQTDSAAKFVVDLRDLVITPVVPDSTQENPESEIAVWSPYDIVVRSTISHLRWLWKRNMDLLPALPKSLKALPGEISRARASIPPIVRVKPPLELIAQEEPNYCAAAAVQMILKHHGENFGQTTIAQAINTVTGGSLPEDQVAGINNLVGTKLRAELDDQPSPEKAQCEILANRPFKVGGPVHARTVRGFSILAGNKTWLDILDPNPPNQGSCCFEPWDVNYHDNFVYVRPLNFEPCRFR